MCIRQIPCWRGHSKTYVDLTRVISGAASIASLTWHDLPDLERNMLDEQFLVLVANLFLCFELNFAIFFGCIWVKNRLCTFKICSPERSDYSKKRINKIKLQ